MYRVRMFFLVDLIEILPQTSAAGREMQIFIRLIMDVSLKRVQQLREEFSEECRECD